MSLFTRRGASEPEKIDLQTFLDRLRALTDPQRVPGQDQEDHVLKVAAIVALLDLEDPEVLALCEDPSPGRGTARITTRYREAGFELSALAFDPGDTVPLHDHPDMTGVILCVRGEVGMESFKLLDDRSMRGFLLLQRTERVRMTSGRIGTLTTERGNIHSLKAMGEVRMLDVFTPPYNNERTERSRWFRRSQTPYEGRVDVFEAWEA